MIIKAALMGIGLALTVLELQVEQPDGVVLVIAGLLFGTGLHWYRKGFDFRTLLVAVCMAMAFPLAVGAVTMEEWLLGLLAALAVGVGWRMCR